VYTLSVGGIFYWCILCLLVEFAIGVYSVCWWSLLLVFTLSVLSLADPVVVTSYSILWQCAILSEEFIFGS